MSDIGLKPCDLLEFSKMCASEYNMPELSDRVLVFDVMRDDWASSSIFYKVSHSKHTEKLASTLTAVASSEKDVLKNLEEPLSDGNSTKEEVKSDVEKPGIDCVSESVLDETYDQSDESEDKPTNRGTTEPATDDADEDDKPGDVSANFKEPIRQRKIYVHSFWLSVQSPYFRSLFYTSGMKENKDAEVHVKVFESEENAHLVLIEALYCIDVLNGKTVDELLLVLELADKYGTKFVFKKCKYVLEKSVTTFEISSQIMHMTRVKHHMDDVEDLAVIVQSALAREFSPLDNSWHSEKFINLPKPSLKYLLSSDDLIVASENTIFHALMYWIEQNDIDPTRFEETDDLLAVVRFQLVTVDYLYNVIQNHPIASKMPKFNELYQCGMAYHAISANQKNLLEKRPVVRKKSEGVIFQHEYLIKKETFDLTKQTESFNSSDEFWACGYKLSTGLMFYESRMYPCLIVNNLKKESLVHLNFLFTSSKTNMKWTQHEFTMTSSRKTFIQTIPYDKNFNLHVAILPL